MKTTSEYNPVSIRYQHNQQVHASSGIHIIIRSQQDGRFIDDFVLTISHIPNILDFQILITEHLHQLDKEDDDVFWNIAKIKEIKNIEFERLVGFDLFPIDSFTDHNQSHRTQLLKLSCSNLSDSGMVISSVSNDLEILNKIKIVGYPFNLTNSLIFKNYQISGHIVGKYSGFYLSDIRYVENLNGGIVFDNKCGGDGGLSKLSGLILGNLRKRNGDGDLTVIFGISEIIKLLNLSLLIIKPQLLLSNSQTTTATQKSSKIDIPLRSVSNSILPLLVTDSKGDSSWGSSIHYKQNILITNHHVIQPYLSQGTCQIYLPTATSIHLSSKDQIIIPIKNLDLAYILINDPHNQTKLESSSSFPITGIGSNYGIGDTVYTFGYGLYFNPNTNEHQFPIVSKGEINCIYSMELQKGLEKSCKKLNSLLIASSNVWNGSSGGGLFIRNNRQQKGLGDDGDDGDDGFLLLVGLICSNANVRIPKYKSTEYTLEKNSSFAFIIPIELIEYIYYAMILAGQDQGQLNDNLIKLWNLENFHHDILIHPTKL